MSKILITLALMTTLTANAAQEYLITGLTPHLRDSVFKLKNNTEDLIVLDCSSFFHNLTITSKSNEIIHYLSVEECENIYQFYRNFSFQKKCLTDYESEIVYHYCD